METITTKERKARELVAETERRLFNLRRIAKEEKADKELAEVALRESTLHCMQLEEKLENKLRKESVQDALTSLFNNNLGKKQEVEGATETNVQEEVVEVIIIASLHTRN